MMKDEGFGILVLRFLDRLEDLRFRLDNFVTRFRLPKGKVFKPVEKPKESKNMMSLVNQTVKISNPSIRASQRFDCVFLI